MAIFDLFSKRQKRARGEMPDVFKYDDLPRRLRVQIIQIVTRCIPEQNQRAWKRLHDILIHELGIFYFKPPVPTFDGPRQDFANDMFNFFLEVTSAEEALDFVEVWFAGVIAYARENYHDGMTSPQQAIEELNVRFREHGVGYEFVSGEIIRVDSALIHQEAVKPTLVVLRDKRFAAAEGEFLSAYEHYRHGRHEEALTDALKSMESVLKVICKKQNWPFNETDTASKLLKVVFEQELVPNFLQTEITGVRTTLEAGIATIRNKQGGHGAGAKPRDVPRHMVSYGLHLTASSILFLTEAEAALK